MYRRPLSEFTRATEAPSMRAPAVSLTLPRRAPNEASCAADQPLLRTSKTKMAVDKQKMRIAETKSEERDISLPLYEIISTTGTSQTETGENPYIPPNSLRNSVRR